MNDVSDRGAGCLLGLALGDALGAPFEFRRAREVPFPLPTFELPWMGLPPGTTTDDTAMARNLARSLAERGGLDLDDLVARHVEWFAAGPPDVGSLTAKVLSQVQSGEGAKEAARAIWEQRGPEASAGNGSVMYCAPLGVAYANRPTALLELAPPLSALTHFDGRCRTATLAVVISVAALVRGDPPGAALAAALTAAQEREGGEELEFLVEAAGVTRPIDGPDQSFCLYTAAVALQALVRGGPFDEGLVRTVGLGGDTDTNAAVAGALLGARDGLTELPAHWVARLSDSAAIIAEARGLAPLALQR